MDCLILPVSILKSRYSSPCLGYRRLSDETSGEDPVTVIVGKEKREFLIDPLIFQTRLFRILIDFIEKENRGSFKVNCSKRVIYVDVDAILFEHILWLMKNDCSSFLQLNLKEIVEFYGQDY